MISQEYKSEMLSQLDMLDNEERETILKFIRSLVTTKGKGVEGEKLLHFSGLINSNDLQLMERVIEEGCERVNLNEW